MDFKIHVAGVLTGFDNGDQWRFPVSTVITILVISRIKRRKANWIGHILRRNCLLKHVIEGKLE
jgi:hypothetical protein